MSVIAGQRPLDIGRALDAAIAIYRRYFLAIVAAMAVAVVPLQLLTFAPRPWNLVGSALQAVVLGGSRPAWPRW